MINGDLLALEPAAQASLVWQRLLGEVGLTEIDVEPARRLVSDHRIGLISSLLRSGVVTEEVAINSASDALGLERCSRAVFASAALRFDSAAHQLGLSMDWCRSQRLFLAQIGERWHGFFADLPTDAQLAVLRQVLHGHGCSVRFVPLQWLETYAERGDVGLAGSTTEQVKLLAEDGPVIELVNQVLSTGATQRASDIHVEARESEFVVRYRIDGRMSGAVRYARELFDAFIVRVKILAQLDISERRLPQDGRIQVKLNGQEYDIRVSVLPASYGEGVVMRLLRSKRMLFSLGDLGLHEGDESTFEDFLAHPNGIVLVTGPTGSGKSTTLYTALSKLNDGQRKIVTVEDPVEYRIEGITQIQTNAAIGLDFATSLRSILRHDPDVILLGEIRDKETASIAVQAALTGHLVLSTLHTNSAVSSITRLIDMGVEPFLVSASVRGLLAQRLVRRLCEHCKVPMSATDELAQASNVCGVDLHGAQLFGASVDGCDHCNHTGFRGRIALYEFATMTDALRSLIRQGDFVEAHLAAAARTPSVSGETRQNGTMLADGVRKVVKGITTIEEVLAVVEQV